MLLSTAYRQASSAAAGRATARRRGDRRQPVSIRRKLDPGNELLWRMRLRRLESETIRDCLLATSGQLGFDHGGPPMPIEALPDGRVMVAEDKLARPTDKFRRSVYLLFRRAYNISLLTVFDQPLVSTTCPIRDTSAVALQSLTMMNDGFVTEQAEQFADRVAAAAQASGVDEDRDGVSLGADPFSQRGRSGHLPAVAPPASQIFQDRGDSTADAEHKSLVQLCLTLLNTNEFLYVQ